jgi:RNA polymerase sigma factor (TIGR02999 family)
VSDANTLSPEVYAALRDLAGRYWRRHGAGHTLEPTSLVHEAWLKLAESSAFSSREHFLAVASRAMRQVLVDRARARGADKRGGGWERVTLANVGRPEDTADLLDLDEALTALGDLDPRGCDIVQMRVFGGMTSPEIAAALGVSLRTVEADWRLARAWLVARLAEGR